MLVRPAWRKTMMARLRREAMGRGRCRCGNRIAAAVLVREPRTTLPSTAMTCRADRFPSGDRAGAALSGRYAPIAAYRTSASTRSSRRLMVAACGTGHSPDGGKAEVEGAQDLLWGIRDPLADRDA
ncbi:hypothetical protein WKI71_44635 [Streptomyces sp. MS1.AVA.1]|uniref:Uncharacterized protein n=1 Tax=Streptomyces machairae TaxID=3134109 RepID=A0ABU8UVE6_9ACTN